ncbi:MAG: hypothetical protein FJX46_15680 [Alphaproteobacteria bacterium]|nr:hypothetical protein [Alphaproteobacteria bacterium]
MNEREKLLRQIRILRSGIDPRVLARYQSVAMVAFAGLMQGKAAAGRSPQRPAPAPVQRDPAFADARPASDPRERAQEAQRARIAAQIYLQQKGMTASQLVTKLSAAQGKAAGKPQPPGPVGEAAPAPRKGLMGWLTRKGS